MNIKLKWRYASGEYDTKTLKLSAIQAIPTKGEVDAELAIDDGMTLSFANAHLGVAESSNAFAKEIVRRWNEFPEELKQ